MKMGRRLRCSSVTSSTSLTARRANQLATYKRQTGAGCSLYRQSGSDRLAGSPF